MKYASISIDRREAYYERAATLIAADPLDFYTRAEAGRKVQAGIKPRDLQPFTTDAKPAPATAAPEAPATSAAVFDFQSRSRRHA